MGKFIRVALSAALAATVIVPASSQELLKTKTKSNQSNDRVIAAPIAQGTIPAVDGLSFSWGASNPQVAQLTTADFAPVSGTAFSECADVCSASAKVSMSSFNIMKRAAESSGPGSVTLHFADGSSVCAAAAGPIKGAVIKGGRNPGGDYALTGAVVTQCDSSGMTVSYQRMAINEKGTGGNNGTSTK